MFIFFLSQSWIWPSTSTTWIFMFLTAVIHHLDQIPECMTHVHFLIILSSTPPPLWLIPVGEPGTSAFLPLLLLTACCYARWCGSHRFLGRFMWTPIPSPVAAGTSGGSLSELTRLVMFLQPLTWQTIANRNEPPAREARSDSAHQALVYQTTREGSHQRQAS